MWWAEKLPPFLPTSITVAQKRREDPWVWKAIRIHQGDSGVPSVAFKPTLKTAVRITVLAKICRATLLWDGQSLREFGFCDGKDHSSKSCFLPVGSNPSNDKGPSDVSGLASGTTFLERTRQESCKHSGKSFHKEVLNADEHWVPPPLPYTSRHSKASPGQNGDAMAPDPLASLRSGPLSSLVPGSSQRLPCFVLSLRSNSTPSFGFSDPPGLPQLWLSRATLCDLDPLSRSAYTCPLYVTTHLTHLQFHLQLQGTRGEVGCSKMTSSKFLNPNTSTP